MFAHFIGVSLGRADRCLAAGVRIRRRTRGAGGQTRPLLGVIGGSRLPGRSALRPEASAWALRGDMFRPAPVNLFGHITACNGMGVSGTDLGTDLGTGSEIERLYRAHGPRLWWSLVAFTGDREVASDAVAEAFAQALRRGDDLQDILAWVWHVAFRVASGEMKRQRALDYRVPEVADPREQRATLLVAVLRQLPTNQRAAIILHYYADLSAADIASMMGISVATVRVHLHRGRARMRRLLEEDNDRP